MLNLPTCLESYTVKPKIPRRKPKLQRNFEIAAGFSDDPLYSTQKSTQDSYFTKKLRQSVERYEKEPRFYITQQSPTSSVMSIELHEPKKPVMKEMEVTDFDVQSKVKEKFAKSRGQLNNVLKQAFRYLH